MTMMTLRCLFAVAALVVVGLAATATMHAIVLPKQSVHKWPGVPTVHYATKDSDTVQVPVSNKSPPSLSQIHVPAKNAKLES